MRQRFQNVAPAPLWKDSPSYPGAPELPIVKQSTAKGATYETVVIHPAGIGARYGGCVGIGIGVWVSTRLVTAEWVIVALIAVGLVFTLYGGVGLLLLLRGDRNWYTYAPGVSMTLMQPERTEAALPTERAFVASENGTIRVGKFQPDTLRALLNTANNVGKITRDGAVGKVPRHLYGDGKWGDTLAELMRLDMIDDEGRLTNRGRDYRAGRPHPDMMTFARTPVDRPTGDRDATDPAEDGAGGYE